MSNDYNEAPFEFSYRADNGRMDMDRTPDLGRLLDDFVNEEFDEGDMQLGVLAFDDQMRVVGVRVLVSAPVDNKVDADGWDETAAWLRDEMGVKDFMTYVRRPADYGKGATPTGWDMGFVRATKLLGMRDGLSYQGHVITDGKAHSFGEVVVDPLEGQTDKEVADIGRGMVAKLASSDKIDPDDIAILEDLMDQLETDGRSPEALDKLKEQLPEVIEAMERISKALGGDPNLAGRMLRQFVKDKPDDEQPPQQRPNIPPAFLN